MTSLALKKFPRRSYFALQRAYYRCVCYQKNSVMYYFQKGERDERIREQECIESTCNVAGYIMIEQCTTQ